ncbi:MAG: U32 family peptidase C-terminal domain-containing protein [[Eubacterium] siraeum]
MNITQRNYFTVHDGLEVLSPGKDTCKAGYSPYLINSKGEQTEIANRATEKMYFDYPVSFPPHSIIRKPLSKK